MEHARLIDDPRWPEFVERYSDHLPLFAVEVCGEAPTCQQEDLYLAVQPFGSKTSVSSGRGTGKTRGIAVIATWHLLCFFSQQNMGSTTIITAPKIDQVRKLSWKEITALKQRIKDGPHGWIADYYEVEAETVFVKGFKPTWWITAKTAPKGSPENVSGEHGEYMLLIADEASGVPDENLKTLVDTMTDNRNRMLMTSQPTRPVGYFYESHHKLSRAEGGFWNTLTLNAEESPLVSREKIAELQLEYGGRDAEQYQISVLGRFPETSSKYLIGRSVLEKVFDTPAVIPAGMPYGWLVIVDVAAGEYRDKSVVTVGKAAGFADYGPDARRLEITGIPVCSNIIQPRQLAGRVKEVATGLKDATVLVDAGGMGIIFAKELEAMDVANLVKVKWGNPCFNARHKEMYVNQRAQCNVAARNAVKAGRLGIHPAALIDGAGKGDILSQGSRIPYSFDERARYQIARKNSEEWEGMPSPDIWDTVAMAFLADAHYIVSDGAGESDIAHSGRAASGKSPEEKADEAFADA